MARQGGLSEREAFLVEMLRSGEPLPTDRAPRKTFGTGWHAHEIVEANRHLLGAKEAVREIRDQVAARIPEPEILSHALRCLIGAQLGGCKGGAGLELAHRIHSVELAAHLAAMHELPPMANGGACVFHDQALARPQEAHA